MASQLKCPKCGSQHSTTRNTRTTTGNSVRRRRLCKECGMRYSTRETICTKTPGAEVDDDTEPGLLLISGRELRRLTDDLRMCIGALEGLLEQ